jgi:uncharacterized protein
VTDPSHTLSDAPDEGDPAASRTTTPENASAAADTPSVPYAPDAPDAPEIAASADAADTTGARQEPDTGASETADTSSSVVDGGHDASTASNASDVSVAAASAPSADAKVMTAAALGFPEGEPQALHPAHLRTQLIGHWITVCVMSFGAFTILSSLTLGGALRGARLVVLPALAVTVISLIAFGGWRYSYLEHRRTSFVISAAGCEIRRGVLWRRIITVPLSRIQHTDVTQGPLQRAYGLATLTLYTAGTEHAKVDLSGLAFETAMAIRQYLFERSEAYEQSQHAAR